MKKYIVGDKVTSPLGHKNCKIVKIEGTKVTLLLKEGLTIDFTDYDGEIETNQSILLICTLSQLKKS